jgi:hypothetical protein
MEGAMRIITIALAFVLLSFAAVSASARKPLSPPADVQNEIRAAFGEILDLWRDGKFEELYLRTDRHGKQSKESFRDRLSTCGHRPACCWEKLQDVRVKIKTPCKATVYARVGMEWKDGSTEYVTRKFTMKKEDGVWKIPMSDVLSLAGKTGKKK